MQTLEGKHSLRQLRDNLKPELLAPIAEGGVLHQGPTGVLAFEQDHPTLRNPPVGEDVVPRLGDSLPAEDDPFGEILGIHQRLEGGHSRPEQLLRGKRIQDGSPGLHDQLPLAIHP